MHGGRSRTRKGRFKGQPRGNQRAENIKTDKSGSGETTFSHIKVSIRNQRKITTGSSKKLEDIRKQNKKKDLE